MKVRLVFSPSLSTSPSLPLQSLSFSATLLPITLFPPPPPYTLLPPLLSHSFHHPLPPLTLPNLSLSPPPSRTFSPPYLPISSY